MGEFKLPATSIPEPLLPGVRGWRTPTGVAVLRVHYTADPERCTDEWLTNQLVGYRGGMEGRDWRREMEIDFTAYKGDPVYPEFAATSMRNVTFSPALPLWRGWDFGFNHPAVVFMQYDKNTDHLYIIDEIYPTQDKQACPGLSTKELGQRVIAHTLEYYSSALDPLGPGLVDHGDPYAAVQHGATSELSSLEILSQLGIDIVVQRVGVKNRVEYVRNYVERPSNFSIHPKCNLILEALQGGYRYPEEAKGSADRDQPDKSAKAEAQPYNHLMDALGYAVSNELPFDYVSVDRPNPGAEAAEERQIAAQASGTTGYVGIPINLRHDYGCYDPEANQEYAFGETANGAVTQEW